MHVLAGEQSEHAKIMQVYQLHGWGRMFVRRPPTPYPYEPWGFDNGAFGWWKRKLPFDESTYMFRLDRALLVPQDPYLAVVPDIVAAGLHSLEFSLKWRERLPNNWPWYLAVQDGMTPADVLPVMHLFAGLFLGGTDGFKRSAYQWLKLAHLSGKKFHYARAGTLRKMQQAFRIGSDSCDSAVPLWSKEQLTAFVRALAKEENQRLLFEEDGDN